MTTYERSRSTVWVGACLIAALLPPTASHGQVTYSESGGGEESPVVIHMTVSPAPAPSPALKYRLTYRDLDLKPGNAATYYYRAMLGLPQVQDQLTKKFGDDWNEWYRTGSGATPISDLPLEKLREAVSIANPTLDDQLAHAVIREDCDWDLGENSLSGPEAIALLLPEMQESRGLSRLLALKTKLAIAEGRTDDAIATMRMSYRMAVDVARPTILVSGFVGIAEAAVTNATLTELIAQPNSPNMYWALTELPQPLINLRDAARFEGSFPERMFPYIRDAASADRTPDEWNLLYQQTIRDLPSIGGAPGFRTPNYEMAAALLAVVAYPHAKERLLQQGMASDKLEAMPVSQVIAIYSEQVTRQLTDEGETLWLVPYWEMQPLSSQFERRLGAMRPFGGGDDREVIPLATLLVTGIQGARRAQMRLEREIAALRVIEALRMWAADHEGTLPNRLDQVTEVPVPPNPATGRPFEYRLEGNVGILEVQGPTGSRRDDRRYEISIRRERSNP